MEGVKKIIVTKKNGEKAINSKLDVEHMPPLTEKEQLFVMGVAEGLSYRDAAKKVWPNTRTATNNLLRIRAKPDVQIWLNFITESLIVNKQKSLEERIARMDRLSMISEQNGNFGAAITAEEKAGKLEGHYIDRKEITHKRDTFDSLIELAKRGTSEFNTALKYAKELGYEKRFSTYVQQFPENFGVIDLEILSESEENTQEGKDNERLEL